MLIGMPMSIKIADVHCNFKKRIMFRSDAYFFFLLWQQMAEMNIAYESYPNHNSLFTKKK